jgi:hypothetical protein
MQPTSQNNPPSKLAIIQANAAQKDDVQSHKEESGNSSPRSEGTLSVDFFLTVLNSRLSVRLSIAR